MSAPKNASIQFRVPEGFKAEIQAICESKQISLTEYCLEKLTPSTQIAPINAQVLHQLSNGGAIEKASLELEIPSNTLANLSALGGGAFVGIVVYKSLKSSLQSNNPEWTDEKIEAIAMVTGIASALLSGYGIHQIVKGLSSK